MNKLQPPTCYWLPRPYTDEDQTDVNHVMNDNPAEFVQWASLYRLSSGMKYARKTGVDLVITEGPDDEAPKLDGWAAAVRATHLITGEITPPPADDIQQLLDSLEMYGNNGWGDFKTNVGTQTKLLGQRLADAGCSPDYVVSYYIGHGLAWDTADRLHTFLRRNVKLA